MGEGKYWILPVFAYTCRTGYIMIQDKIVKKTRKNIKINVCIYFYDLLNVKYNNQYQQELQL